MFTLPLVLTLASTFLFVSADMTQATADDHGLQVALSGDQPQDAPAVGRGAGRGRQAAARGRRGGTTEEKRIIKVYQLKYADCRDFAEIPGAMLLGMPIQVDRGTNSLIINATETQIEEVEKLIETLDKPAVQNDLDVTRVIPIQHRNPHEIAGQLRGLFAGQGLRIAADESLSCLLMNGPAVYAAKAEEVIRSLDRKAETAHLEFAFFKASLDSSEDDVDETVPEDLKEVASELKRFGKVKLMGQLHTLATESEAFDVSGYVATQAFTRTQGKVLAGAPEGSLKLSLDAHLWMTEPPASEEDEQQTEAKQRGRAPGFELETVITIKKGDYVVLGSAPGGWAKGESVILVFQVQP